MAQKQDVAERDSRITQLTREKEELQAQLRKTEQELKLEQSKTQGAHKLIGLLEENVRNPGDLVIKARLYDEAIAKTGGVTALKMIHICVDYSTRMETILAEMRILFYNRNRFFRGSPVPLEKVPDLTDFPDLPPTELLQNLQTPTTLRTTRDSTEALGSDARTSEADRPQQEAPTSVPGPEPAPVPEPTSTPVPEPAPTPEDQDSVLMDTTETPPLPIDLALVVPSRPTTSPMLSNQRPKVPFPAPTSPLSETARKYMESVRRQAAFTHTPGFQELLSQGLSQASPQRSLFRHPASAFGTLPSPQEPPPLPALPMPRRVSPASRLPRLATAEPSARRKAKPTAAPIELEDSEDNSAKTTPPRLDIRDRSRNQSNFNPPLIPPHPEPVTTQSSGRAQVTSRSKQKSSKRPVTDKGKPSKRPKK